jgi:hypothetical protein
VGRLVRVVFFNPQSTIRNLQWSPLILISAPYK